MQKTGIIFLTVKWRSVSPLSREYKVTSLEKGRLVRRLLGSPREVVVGHGSEEKQSSSGWI